MRLEARVGREGEATLLGPLGVYKFSPANAVPSRVTVRELETLRTCRAREQHLHAVKQYGINSLISNKDSVIVKYSASE